MLPKLFRNEKSGLAERATGPLHLSGEARAVADANGLAVFHAGCGQMFKANVVGALIWRGIEAGRPPAALARDLVAQYGVTADRAQDDIVRFMAELRAAGLLIGGRN